MLSKEQFQWMQQYMLRLYATQSINAPPRQHIAETYGEILCESMQKLIKKMQINQQDIFYDLGSGTGKVVMQVFLSTSVKAAYGIECMPHLHQFAQAAQQQLQQELPAFYHHERQLHYYLGSFFDISFRDATIIYIGSPCFTQSMLNTLSRQMNQLPQLHTIISLRPFNHLEHLHFKKAIRVECSWDSALCYLYQR